MCQSEIEPTVKLGGGTIMVWGSMTIAGVGIMHRILGLMWTSSIMGLFLHVFALNKDKTVFQPGSDLKHISLLAKDWSLRNDIVLNWSTRSPDLNPINDLWPPLKNGLNSYAEKSKGIPNLWDWAKAEWYIIPVKKCQNLMSSMPSRTRAVIRAKVGHAKYWKNRFVYWNVKSKTRCNEVVRRIIQSSFCLSMEIDL